MSGIWIHDDPIPFRRSNSLSYQAMCSSYTQSELCRAIPISSHCSVFTCHFSHHLCQWHMSEAVVDQTGCNCGLVYTKQKQKTLAQMFEVRGRSFGVGLELVICNLISIILVVSFWLVSLFIDLFVCFFFFLIKLLL